MMLRCHLVFVALLFGATHHALRARGEQPAAPVKITLYPAAAPQPLLKYRLLPEFIDRIPGNAAVYYGKVKAEQNQFFSNRQIRDNMDRWYEAPLDDLRREKAHVPLEVYYLEQAARCEYCNWQLPIRREPPYGIRLSEVQEVRQFSKIICTQARILLANGDAQSAIERLQLSYALARHVAEGETLVNGLVGLAVFSITNRQVRDLLQQQDAPNLYWALSTMPQPMVDFRDALEAELSAFELAIPELRRPEQSGRSGEQWRTTLLQLITMVHEFADDPAWKEPPESLLKRYLHNDSGGERRLIERGWTKEDIEAMAAEQVALLDLMTQHHEIGQDALVSFFLAYPEAKRRLDDAQRRADALNTDKTPSLASIYLGPFLSCRTAQARIERDFAVLQVLEALRLHAANQGGLPNRLRDVVDVPIPNDPVTGRPFRYLRDGDVARLGGPEVQNIPLDYEITLKRASNSPEAERPGLD
jgi:hypothetical protein